jgi:TolA-binding protein
MTGMFDQVRQKGEQRFSRLAGELMSNERFMAAVEAALNTKSFLERKIKTVLHTMSVASRLDIDELRGKLDESERKLRQMTKRVEALQRQVEEAAARNAELSALLADRAAAPPDAAVKAPKPALPAETPTPATAVPSNGGAAGAASPMEAVCLNCGKSFQKKSYNQRYCSAACRSGVSSGS